jgi:hypothetical protein
VRGGGVDALLEEAKQAVGPGHRALSPRRRRDARRARREPGCARQKV